MLAGFKRRTRYLEVVARVGQVEDQIDARISEHRLQRIDDRHAMPLAQQLRAVRLAVVHTRNPQVGMQRQGAEVVVRDEAAADDRYVHRM